MGTFTHRFFDFVDETQDRLRLVEFHDDVLDRVGARTEPARASRARAFIKQILDRVIPIFG
jgi:hypothetical protein